MRLFRLAAVDWFVSFGLRQQLDLCGVPQFFRYDALVQAVPAFDGFEPLTVGLTLWVDLNFRDQMFHQLFTFNGIHHIVELFKADENFVNVIARDFIRFDSLLLCPGIHQVVFGFPRFYRTSCKAARQGQICG